MVKRCFCLSIALIVPFFVFVFLACLILLFLHVYIFFSFVLYVFSSLFEAVFYSMCGNMAIQFGFFIFFFFHKMLWHTWNIHNWFENCVTCKPYSCNIDVMNSNINGEKKNAQIYTQDTECKIHRNKARLI